MIVTGLLSVSEPPAELGEAALPVMDATDAELTQDVSGMLVELSPALGAVPMVGVPGRAALLGIESVIDPAPFVTVISLEVPVIVPRAGAELVDPIKIWPLVGAAVEAIVEPEAQ